MTAPNGRFADSGAIFVEGGGLAMSRTSVIGNSAIATVAFPDSVDTLAIAGGLHVGGDLKASISHTTIADNRASMTNSIGTAFAFTGGAHTDSDGFTLDHDVITHNEVSAVASGPQGDAEADSGAGEIGGTVTHTILINNRVDATSAYGDAYALGGAGITIGTFTHDQITENRAASRSQHGRAITAGAGLDDGGDLTLEHTIVTRNHAETHGSTGILQGGGIFAATTNYAPPASSLTIVDSTISFNVLMRPAGQRQGGGIFTTLSPVITRTVIRNNRPDQLAYG